MSALYAELGKKKPHATDETRLIRDGREDLMSSV